MLSLAALRMLIRAFTFSRLILFARILGPQGFGVVGIALSVGAISFVITGTGLRTAMIQRDSDDVHDFTGTYFVVNIVRGLLVGTLMAVLAPVVASFFNEDSLVPILRLVGLSVAISGFASAGLVLYEREFNVAKRLKLTLPTELIEIGVSVALLLILRDPVAVGWGLVAGSIAAVPLSYLIAPYWPKTGFSFEKFKILYSFGIWSYLSGVIQLISGQADALILGRVVGASSVGIYRASNRIPALVSEELGTSLRVLTFPLYSRLQNNLTMLRKALLGGTEILATIAVASAAVIILFADDMLILLYGEEFREAADTLRILALAAAVKAIDLAMDPVFTALGKPRLEFAKVVTRSAIIVVTIVPFVAMWGMQGAAYAMLLSVSVAFIGFLPLTASTLQVGLFTFVKTFITPAMFLAVPFLAIAMLHPGELPWHDRSILEISATLAISWAVVLVIAAMLHSGPAVQVKLLAARYRA